MNMTDTPELSFVIPCYNEQDNVRALVKSIQESVEPLKLTYEIVITDDCSKDNSWEALKGLLPPEQARWHWSPDY